MNSPAHSQPPEPSDPAAVAPNPAGWTVPRPVPAPPPASHSVIAHPAVPQKPARRAAWPEAQQLASPVADAVALPTPAPAGRHLEPQGASQVEQPRTQVPPRTPPDASVPLRENGTSGRRRLVPWLVWQLALVTAGVALQAPTAVRWSLLALAVASLVMSVVRVRSAWLYQWVGWLLSYLLRSHRTVLPDSDDKAEALVESLVGQTVLRTVDVRGEPAVVVGTEDGVAMILRPRSTDLVRHVPGPVDLLRAVDDQPTGVVAQTVLHTGTRRGEPRVWFVIRVLRSPEVARDGDVEQVLGNAVRRVVKELTRHATDPVLVDANDARSALSSLAHVNAGRGDLRESWRMWSAGPVLQATFRLHGLDRLEPAAVDSAVSALLQGSIAVATTVALTARRDHSQRVDVPAAGGVLRVAAGSWIALEKAAIELSSLGAARGVRLERLDGRHRAGVTASLPLGIPSP